MDLFRERSSCLAMRFFTAVTLALSYRDQAAGFATLTRSGAPPPLHAGVSSKESSMVAVFQESQGTNSAFAGFCPVSPSNRRNQRKTRAEKFSNLMGAPFGTLKWYKHRVMLRSIGEDYGLLCLICLPL